MRDGSSPSSLMPQLSRLAIRVPQHAPDAGADRQLLQEDPAAAEIPDELIECVLRHLESSTSRRHLLAVCGVSRGWRALGRRLFFSRPWDAPQLITHPAQLFGLSPRPVPGSRSGLLKCFVQRQADRRGLVRFTLWAGHDPGRPSRGRFLLCATRVGRTETHLHLGARGEGPPCAVLSSNLLATRYALRLAGCQLAPPPEAGTGGSGGGGAAATGGSRASVCGGSCSAGGPGPASVPGTAPSGGGYCSPEVLAELFYCARVRGFMQPRRMRVRLPHPSRLSFGPAGLPQLVSMRSSGSSCQGEPAASMEPAGLAHRSGRAAEQPGTPRCAAVEACGGQPASPTAPAVSPDLTGGSGAGGGDGAEALQPSGSGRLSRRLLRLLQRTCAQPVAPPKPPSPAQEALPPVTLRNKPPHWNDGLHCWCLNFRGRVKLASVKNLQLMRSEDEGGRVVLQFGRVDRDLFVLDFDPGRLCAAQAFAVALSTFESKVIV